MLHQVCCPGNQGCGRGAPEGEHGSPLLPHTKSEALSFLRLLAAHPSCPADWPEGGSYVFETWMAELKLTIPPRACLSSSWVQLLHAILKPRAVHRLYGRALDGSCVMYNAIFVRQ